MLVRVAHPGLDDAPAEAAQPWLPRFDSFRTTELQRGREYVVYAVLSMPEGLAYHIDVFHRGSCVYPFAYPGALFEVFDARISRWWADPIPGASVHSIAAWMADDDFYDKLLEGWDDGAARATFATARDRMELEFLVPSKVKARGEKAGEGWVECKACDYVWQNEATVLDEMCVCANCHLLLGLA